MNLKRVTGKEGILEYYEPVVLMIVFGINGYTIIYLLSMMLMNPTRMVLRKLEVAILGGGTLI